MNPEYPVFIPSKGRYETPYTIRMFERMKVPFIVVVEPQEYEKYKTVVREGEILVTPHQNEGLWITRNFIWDYAQNELKAKFFWSFDDNIKYIVRVHKNIKRYVDCGTPLKVIEDFAARYLNLYISGMNYWMFVPRKKKKPPITLNTRIYSNTLIRTDIPYRNRLFYNDDTDLCLQVLKDGHCTALFNAFLADKIATMTVKGGMTEYYDGKASSRFEASKLLQETHPDVTELTQKWGRWHHHVDYSSFRRNRLKRDLSVKINKGAVNNYDMKMIELDYDPERMDLLA